MEKTYSYPQQAPKGTHLSAEDVATFASLDQQALSRSEKVLWFLASTLWYKSDLGETEVYQALDMIKSAYKSYMEGHPEFSCLLDKYEDDLPQLLEKSLMYLEDLFVSVLESQ